MDTANSNNRPGQNNDTQNNDKKKDIKVPQKP